MNKNFKELVLIVFAVIFIIMCIVLDGRIINKNKKSEAKEYTLTAGITNEAQQIMKENQYEYQDEYKNIYNVTIKNTPSNNSFKSYMDAKYITSKSSAQYKLKSKYVLSDIGVYTVDGRYCIAMGSYYTHTIGTKVDLVMYNGNVVKCIIADCKADEHTDRYNRQNPNGSMVEFIVHTNSLSQEVKNNGNLSYSQDDSLQGEIAYVIIYE